jgi:hypothetical protein
MTDPSVITVVPGVETHGEQEQQVFSSQAGLASFQPGVEVSS